MRTSFAMILGPLPDGFKLWLEVYRELPDTGFRARIEKHPDAVDSIDPDSALGRWRYLDHPSDLEDYLLNLRPTHYFQLDDSMPPLLIARDFELVERLPDVRTKLISSKSQSFFIAGSDQSQIQERLTCWDSRPRWRIVLNRKSAREALELVAQPNGTTASPFTTEVRLLTPTAFVEFLRRLDANELERKGPGAAVRRSLLIGLEGNLQAVASEMQRELVEFGYAAVHLRPTSPTGLLHRLIPFRPPISDGQA